MYATHAVDRYAMVKIEQQDRVARAHRRLSAAAPNSGPSTQPTRVHSPNFGRRVAVALATFLLSLGLLAGAAAAQDLTRPSSDGGSGCVRVVGGRTLC